MTAEGVELVEQAEILRQLGCQLVQGFLYARPAPAAELDSLIAHGTRQIGASDDGPGAAVALDNNVANGTPDLPVRAARE